jgi:adenylate cyclase
LARLGWASRWKPDLCPTEERSRNSPDLLPAGTRSRLGEGDGVAAVKRKLTTILCADVAGYSRLMGGDEEGTHRRLVALFSELLEPAIDARGGTLIKKTGDGLLAEFASVVEAARCATEIQAGVADRKADVPDQSIAFRIGNNLGDVIVDAGDVYGDGVNVAARLEGLADPGGIVVPFGAGSCPRQAAAAL